MKTAIAVLTILTLGLCAGLLVQHQRATQAAKTTGEALNSFSNSWQQTKTKLEESEKVASALETKLNARTEAMTTTSNDLAKTSAELAKVNVDLAKRQADFEAAQAELKKQLAQIAELESQRDDLTKKMDELTGNINALESKIGETKKKLAASEGDRAFLLKELARLQNEKATLVAQFNNLAALRAQVAKLKEEAAVNQRLTWMQMGVYSSREKKGAERLLATTPALTKPEARLEVDLDQNGRAKVVPSSNSAPVGP